MDALRFPAYFPPTNKWKKFFIGLRWLGPDLSFFKDLRAMQAMRAQESLAIWGGGKRQAIATEISRILSQQLGWKSQVFLPQDSVAVAFHGPAFDFCDSDSAFEEVVQCLEKDFGMAPPLSFWEGKTQLTLGELIDELLIYGVATNESSKSGAAP